MEVLICKQVCIFRVLKRKVYNLEKGLITPLAPCCSKWVGQPLNQNVEQFSVLNNSLTALKTSNIDKLYNQVFALLLSYLSIAIIAH